jgi:hypothetical protein
MAMAVDSSQTLLKYVHRIVITRNGSQSMIAVFFKSYIDAISTRHEYKLICSARKLSGDCTACCLSLACYARTGVTVQCTVQPVTMPS